MTTTTGIDNDNNIVVISIFIFARFSGEAAGRATQKEFKILIDN